MSAFRFTCTDLVSRVRFLSGVDAAAWPDDDVQTVLDRRRALLSSVAARPVDASYTVWLAPRVGEWEADATAETADGDALTIASADYSSGRFTLTTSATSAYFTGSSFDTYNAAADIVDANLARLLAAGAFDFSTDGQSFQRSQQVPALRQLSMTLRAAADSAGYLGVFTDAPSDGADIVRVVRLDEWGTTSQSTRILLQGPDPDEAWLLR